MSAPLLSSRGVVAGYVPGLPIVHGVSAHVAAGEVVTIIGPNGAGKSTFLKALVGLVPTTDGTVLLRDRDVAGLPTSEIVAAGLGFVPQTGNVFTTLTIHENLTVGGHTVSRAALARGVERAYAMFPALAAKRNERARVLSGGQRQMLAIARALMTDPAVLLLDEPTAGLSPKVVGEVFADLRQLATSGVAVLMVEQNARAALRLSDRGYVLAEGRNRFEGQAADLLADRAVAEAFIGVRHGGAEGH
ncbi:ABC transporter ATP-binding protein [Alsobacter sp. SYSU M60028]|uniref:ABC transporter ATP-binding protein n=1 Tax=Alsobacter ponti TaxID=2962936 RepID=A0ABT1L9L3_9HYPH|nr:ABC transporter ATP-binding protein [Alsobacter ponti]MCP8938164.1 ABC transporter ATP-binding protein [Alsobacter ponti]